MKCKIILNSHKDQIDRLGAANLSILSSIKAISEKGIDLKTLADIQEDVNLITSKLWALVVFAGLDHSDEEIQKDYQLTEDGLKDHIKNFIKNCENIKDMGDDE